jgi:quercetin dioxygenase-like cupin family protein
VSPDIQLLTASKSTRSEFDWGELTWFASGPLKNATGVTVGRCTLKPGEANPRHMHPNCEEVLVVLQGRIRHTGPGETAMEMSVGDTVTIPAGIWHRALNIGTDPAVLFIAFSSADRQTVGE